MNIDEVRFDVLTLSWMCRENYFDWVIAWVKVSYLARVEQHWMDLSKGEGRLECIHKSTL